MVESVILTEIAMSKLHCIEIPKSLDDGGSATQGDHDAVSNLLLH